MLENLLFPLVDWYTDTNSIFDTIAPSYKKEWINVLNPEEYYA